jgi:hypothetical protein
MRKPDRPVIYGQCIFIGFHARGLARSPTYIAREFDMEPRNAGLLAE